MTKANPSTDRDYPYVKRYGENDNPPANQERARMLALDILTGSRIHREDAEYVCRAFLELAVGFK